MDRGTIISVSELNAAYPPGNTVGVTKMDELFMSVVAHELTHTLFEKVNVGAFNDKEHLREQTILGVPQPMYRPDLMYFEALTLNLELATIFFSHLVQQELKVQSNQGIV